MLEDIKTINIWELGDDEEGHDVTGFDFDPMSGVLTVPESIDLDKWYKDIPTSASDAFRVQPAA